MTPPEAMTAGPITAERLRRLRWRSRRGLLENDLVLERFFAKHEDSLGEEEVAGLDELLDLPDNKLLDLILGRIDAESESLGSETIQVLEKLRRC